MCVNGLGQWDAMSDHRRCPIFYEILDRLETHYRETYGPESPEFLAARYSVERYPVGSYEPSVIEKVFNDLVRNESNITVELECFPESAEVTESNILKAVFKHMRNDSRQVVAARVFVDATYEGDLAAAAGVPYRVGREAAAEYDEPHGGFALTNLRDSEFPGMVAQGRLNIKLHGHANGRIVPVDPASSRGADHHIQAYNLRGCVCRDPANRIFLERPPEQYDRAEFLHYRRGGLAIDADIHRKNSCNSPILPGENWGYPEGNWATRERIARRHVNFGLGWMWFLQNDPSVPAERREEAREWGLPIDEYTDNGHLPYEIYVRETRRIVGRHVLSENDLLPREGRLRPRPFEDSIAFTDWYMDSHSCSRDVGTYGQGPDVVGNEDFPFDGKLVPTAEFRPGMVPYRSLVAAEVKNLIVPVCASATHVAWGSVRLEPIWIHLGEVAGFAACQALATGESVLSLDVSRLQKTVLDAGLSIAFFNQHRNVAERSDYGDRQLAACHGEWDNYDLNKTLERA